MQEDKKQMNEEYQKLEELKRTLESSLNSSSEEKE